MLKDIEKYAQDIKPFPKRQITPVSDSGRSGIFTRNDQPWQPAGENGFGVREKPTQHIQPGNYHQKSNTVKNMQDSLIKLANRLNMEFTNLFSPSPENVDKNLMEKLKIDPQLPDKLREVSRNLKGNLGENYGDGLWGEKTQAALNSVYSFIDAVKNVDKNNTSKYDALLTQMSDAGVGKDAKHTYIKPENVNKYAGILTRSVETLDSHLEDLKKAINDSSATPTNDKTVSDQSTGKGVLDSPKDPWEDKSKQQTQQEQSSTKQQENIQQKEQLHTKQQENAQQVNQKEQVNQQNTQQAAAISIWPFDVKTNIISLTQIQNFKTQISILMGNEYFISKGINLALLNSEINTLEDNIGKYTAYAVKISSNPQGGFRLSGEVKNFAETYAGGNYVAARDLLNLLGPIINRSVAIVSYMNGKIDVQEELIREQMYAGENYMSVIGSWINQINNILMAHR